MVINMFDTTYAVSKVPAGFEPGHPFESMAELRVPFLVIF